MGRPKKVSEEVEEKPKKSRKKASGENELLREFIDVSGNEWAEIAENGIESGDIKSFLDTGALAFNAMLSGSIYDGAPDNKVLMLAGEEATGKSFFILSMIKTFLSTRPSGLVVLFETEGGLTKNMLVEREIDPRRILVIPVQTVEEINTQAVKIVDHYLSKTAEYRIANPMIMALDSLGMLSTTKEVTDTASGSDKRDMTRAGQIKKFFRTMTLKLSRAGVALLVTNHTYDEQGLFAQKVMSGGSGGKYAATITVFLGKAKYKEGEEHLGNILTCTLKKGRLTKEGSKVKVLLRYDTGLNRYFGLLPIALEYDIFKQVGKKIKVTDGTEVFESKINKDPERYYTPEILEQIQAACAHKFKFGNSVDLLEEEVEEE
jgi:RecA/RadA recombinase